MSSFDDGWYLMRQQSSSPCYFTLVFQIDGRRPSDAFRTLPLKKDYPDYFMVILEPIDMMVIDGKIKADKVGKKIVELL